MSDTGGVSIDTATAPIAIQLTDIVKRFPGVVANDGVNLTVHQGSVHAIVGENGAGKSTLMKTLYGAHQPNEGTITVKGEQRVFSSPKDAIADGIGMVFQAFMLAANLTVWENIVLGQEPGTKFSLNANEARSRIRDLGERYGLEVDPDALICDLGVGDKQRVEILKVLYRGAEILILDEPTAVLVPQEVDALFMSLRELTTEGATIIFISHKLDEVLKHADAITVIRQGKTVGEVPDPSSVTSRDLAEMMVGSELPTPETRESTVTDQAVLELRNVTVRAADDGGRDLVHDVSFTVHRGEIVGIAGVEGNGQSELVRSLVGLVPSTGTVARRRPRRRSALHPRATRRRHRLHLRGPPEGRPRPGVHAVGERRTRPPPSSPVREGTVARPRRHQGTYRGHRRGVRRAHTGHQRPGVHPVGRQPAEVGRRPRDDRRAQGAGGGAPHPRRRRRRPVGHLGHPA
jgi:general nucleoside transport system ATP-binding protein